MAGMKISLDAAMRARDISQPTPAQETAAELADEAQPRPTLAPARHIPRLAPSPLPSEQVPSRTAAVPAAPSPSPAPAPAPAPTPAARASEATGPSGAQLPSPQQARADVPHPPRRRRMRRRPRGFPGEP